MRSKIIALIVLLLTGLACVLTNIFMQNKAEISPAIDILMEQAEPPAVKTLEDCRMCDFGGCYAGVPLTTEPETELIFREAREEPEKTYTYTVYEENDIYEEPGNGAYLGRFKCTAYCGCYECSEGYGSMTATGVTARADHTIAVDPSVIPYGTWVVINGCTYKAEDCGGGVNGNHIDIFFDSHSACNAFGVRYYDVYLA